MAVLKFNHRFEIEEKDFGPSEQHQSVSTILREWSYPLVIGSALALGAILLNLYRLPPNAVEATQTASVTSKDIPQVRIAQEAPELLPLHGLLNQNRSLSPKAFLQHVEQRISCNIADSSTPDLLSRATSAVSIPVGALEKTSALASVPLVPFYFDFTPFF